MPSPAGSPVASYVYGPNPATAWTSATYADPTWPFGSDPLPIPTGDTTITVTWTVVCPKSFVAVAKARVVSSAAGVPSIEFVAASYDRPDGSPFTRTVVGGV